MGQPGAAEVAQRQRHRLGVEALEGAGPVREGHAEGARLHLLEAHRQHAVHLAAGDGLPGEVQGGRAGGAVVVDVHHRHPGEAHLVGGALPAGGVAVHVARHHLLHLGVGEAGVLEGQADGAAGHDEVGLAGSGLGEGNHSDAGDEHLMGHGGTSVGQLRS